MKEDILIYGIGEGYKRYRTLIDKYYNVVLYMDGKKMSDESIPNTRIYGPDEIDLRKYPSEKIWVMTEVYFDELSGRLHECGISQERIVNGVKFCRELSRREDVEKDSLAQLLISMPIVSMSRQFGLERGTSIDRIYIGRFLNQYRNLITGDCIEIAEDTYTRKFGTNIDNAYIMHVSGENDAIKGNLVTGEGIQERIADCAIITQTLSFLDNPNKAVLNLYKLLKKDGNALITVGGISPLSVYDSDRWGHFIGFYKQGIEALFASEDMDCDITIETYGNVKMVMGFLYGMCAEDYKEEDFEKVDEMYPLIYGIVMHKRS